jgi:hypothetical protein
MRISVPGLSTELEPVAPGTYTAEVSNMELQQSKAGNDMWVVTLRIMDEGPYFGRLLTDRFVVDNPIGRQRLSRLLRAAKVHVVNDEFDTEELIGARLQVAVEHEEGDNGVFERIRRYISVL